MRLRYAASTDSEAGTSSATEPSVGQCVGLAIDKFAGSEVAEAWLDPVELDDPNAFARASQRDNANVFVAADNEEHRAGFARWRDSRKVWTITCDVLVVRREHVLQEGVICGHGDDFVHRLRRDARG